MRQNLDRLWADVYPGGGPGPAVDPADIRTRVNAALDAAPSERRRYMRQRIRFAAVLAAALIALTGAALAVAAHFDVLGAFFEGDTSLAESLVDREARSVSDRNYTLTVESSVSGGTGAYLIVRVEAKTEAARAALLADDFLSIDTFSVNALREENDALAYAGTQSFGMHEEARTDAAITWSVSESHADQASAVRVRLNLMDEGLAVEVPLERTPAVTVEIGAAGPNYGDRCEVLDGTLTVEAVELSPFTCRVTYALPGDAPWRGQPPLLFFRMADGSIRTSAQMVRLKQCTRREAYYQFCSVQDLAQIDSVIVFGRAYPLDGGSSGAAELDGRLLPFTLPLLEGTVDGALTLLPVRALCDGLGASCVWDAAAGTVTCTYRGVSVILTPGSAAALVDGREVALPAPLELRDGKLISPAGLFEDAWQIRFDAPITWSEDGDGGWSASYDCFVVTP